MASQAAGINIRDCITNNRFLDFFDENRSLLRRF